MLRAARRMAKPAFISVTAATHARLVSSSAMPALPALPVPPLATTMAAYRLSLKPILSRSLRRRFDKSFYKFASSPLSATLQQRLEARHASEPSWFADWWNKAMRDAYSTSLMGKTSYFYVHKHLPESHGMTKKLNVSAQALRAAEITAAAWAFRNEVVSGTIAPDTTKDGPLCMEQYKYMFHTYKYPETRDNRVVSFVGAEAVESVIVTCQNHFFEVPMRLPDGSRDLSVAEIATQFQIILDSAQKLDPAPGYGIFTTTDRVSWYFNRRSLIALNPELHPHLLRRIEASAFLVALDDTSPTTLQELSEACWHGGSANGANRWLDKSMQFIVFKNGRSGFCGERSRMDDMVTLRLNESVCSRITRGDFAATGPVDASLPAPTTLDFTAPNEELSDALEYTQRRFKDLIGSQALFVLHIPGIGSKRIKALRVSPDAFAQLVIQLAYHNHVADNHPACEYVSTRKFALGRIETCRVLTNEVVAFCRSMMRREAAPEGKPVPDLNTLAGLARTAMARQSENRKLVMNGMGIDNHLWGLRLMHDESKDGPLPYILTGEALWHSDYWYMATSQMTSEYFDGYGFAAVEKDGFGIAYMIQEDTLCFNLSSHVAHFNEELLETLNWSTGVLAKLLAEDVSVNRKATEAAIETMEDDL